MTAPAETSPLEARVGHYYQMDGTYLVGREKVREYARAVQDYHPAHWDVAAAAELGYSDLVAPLTFTSTPGMTCNRRMFEQIVVGYDTYMQTEEVFEQHRPIVAGDELHVDVELTSVRRIAGRDLITVTNTFTDTAGERVHTLHTTVVGLTAEDLDPGIKTAVQKAMMHDVDIFGVGEADTKDDAPRGRGSDRRGRHHPHAGDAVLRRREGRRRATGAPHPAVPRRPGELRRRGRRRQPDSLGRGHRQAGRAARCDRPRNAHHGAGRRIRLCMVGRPRCCDPLRGAAVRARDRVGRRGRRHRVQRPNQIAGPRDSQRCRHRRREIRWPEDLRPGDVERPLPLTWAALATAAVAAGDERLLPHSIVELQREIDRNRGAWHLCSGPHTRVSTRDVR